MIERLIAIAYFIIVVPWTKTLSISTSFSPSLSIFFAYSIFIFFLCAQFVTMYEAHHASTLQPLHLSRDKAFISLRFLAGFIAWPLYLIMIVVIFQKKSLQPNIIPHYIFGTLFSWLVLFKSKDSIKISFKGWVKSTAHYLVFIAELLLVSCFIYLLTQDFKNTQTLGQKIIILSVLLSIIYFCLIMPWIIYRYILLKFRFGSTFKTISWMLAEFLTFRLFPVILGALGYEFSIINKW